MILGPNGKPLDVTPDLGPKKLVNAEETFQSKKIDTYYDKVFVRHLIRKFQKISPQVGAVFYPHIQCVVFWYGGVIVYKVMLTAHNVDDVSIKRHVEKMTLAIEMVKNNAVLRHKLQEAAKAANKKFGVNL